MAALAADVNCSVIGAPVYGQFTVNAADIYYQGAIVFVDTGGGSQVTWAAGDRVLGVSPVQQNVGTSDLVQVMIHGFIWLPLGASVTAASEGEILMVDASGTTTDNPADATVATVGAGDMAIGPILRVTATQMLVGIGSWTGRTYDGTAAAWV